MLDVFLDVLKEITSHSYKAYIVGGFVRDYLLGIESNDIDICTNATPKEIKEIFKDNCLPNEDYGSVVVSLKGYNFEITTFRKEVGYNDNRHPIEIKYIDDLYEDLLRRDFSINTLCMDDTGKIIDYLKGQDDLNNHIIRTIGDAEVKFSEDSLRILRAIRFATILDFELDEECRKAIIKTKELLSNLSYNRKREELDKIFTSTNYKKGIKLLLELGLDKELEIPNLEKVLSSDMISLIGIWTLLDVSDIYPFNKNELDLMSKVKEVLELDNLDPYTLYKYGLYVNSVVSEIRNDDIKIVTEAYNNLVIKSKDDIDIDPKDIIELLGQEPGKYITDIYNVLEKEILYLRLNNKKDDIIKYIKEEYK